MLRRCRELGILLVVDECFLDFVKEPGKYSLKAQLSRYHNLFILKAFTKRYAMAGIRLGYGLSENEELLGKDGSGDSALEYFCYGRNGRDCCPERKCLCRKGRKQYLRRRLPEKGLEELGFTVYPSEANYNFFQGRARIV